MQALRVDWPVYPRRAEHNTVAEGGNRRWAETARQNAFQSGTPGKGPPMSGVGLCARRRPALAVGSAMPRDGSVTLSDLKGCSYTLMRRSPAAFRPHRQADRHPAATGQPLGRCGPWRGVRRPTNSPGCASVPPSMRPIAL